MGCCVARAALQLPVSQLLPSNRSTCHNIVIAMGKTAIAVRKGIPNNRVDLPSLVSVEATGVCIPIGNSEVLVTAVDKSLGCAWSDVDIIELLSFRR
jgi:hypothetical protein